MPESSPRKERARRLGGTIAVGIYAVSSGRTHTPLVRPDHDPSVVAERDDDGELPGRGALAGGCGNPRTGGGGGGNPRRASRGGRFRAALDPEWSLRPALSRACRDDEQGRRLLREIDQWRYAEERSVRSDAADVARR